MRGSEKTLPFSFIYIYIFAFIIIIARTIFLALARVGRRRPFDNDLPRFQLALVPPCSSRIHRNDHRSILVGKLSKGETGEKGRNTI